LGKRKETNQVQSKEKALFSEKRAFSIRCRGSGRKKAVKSSTGTFVDTPHG
jgi:hypothetical protein